MLILQVYDRNNGVLLAEIQRPEKVNYSLVLNKAGQLTFSIPLNHNKGRRKYLDYGLVVVRYSDSVSAWSGYIVNISWSPNAVEITRMGIEYLLTQRIAEPLKFKQAPAGEIFRHLLNKANAKTQTGLNVGDVWMGGSLTDMAIGTEDIYSKLTELVESTKTEYRVLMLQPGIWEISLYERVGSDLTDTVVIIMGRDTAGEVSYSEDWGTFANSILAVGKQPEDSGGTGGGGEEEDGWAKRPKVWYTDEESVSAYGLSQDILDVSEATLVTALLLKAQQEVEKRKLPKRVLGFSLIGVPALWGKFQEGDIVCCHVPDYSFGGMVVPVKIMARGIDESTRTMSVVGEIIAGAEAVTLKMYLSSAYGGV